MRLVLAAAAVLLLFQFPLMAAEPDLQRSAAAFLDGYARGDKAAVETSLDPKVTLYGSDAAEFYSGLSGFQRMFDGDMKLWRGSAKFGEMRNVSVVRGGDLGAIFFDVPFTLAARPPLPVRFAMVWRIENGGWKLVQSSNVVPTVGQSADDLLKPVAKTAVPSAGGSGAQ